MILLTGASGFIGSAFLKHALVKGWRVRVLTRKPSQFSSQASLDVVDCDLLVESDWSRILVGVKFVVNAAAEINQPSLMNGVNVWGPQRLLQAAVDAGVKRWVQLSSVGSYGPIPSGFVNEDMPDNPSDPYEVSKTNFDKILKHSAENHGIEICIVRPSNVYGPGMRNQSLKQMVNAIRGNLFAFVGPEGSSANYVHVKDVVQALDLCITHSQAANQTYIVSAWATMEEMVSSLAEGARVIPPSRRIPLRLAILLATSMQSWSGWPLTLSRVKAMSVRSRYITEKIEKELGWRLTVPVQEGMREFVRDFCQ